MNRHQTSQLLLNSIRYIMRFIPACFNTEFTRGTARQSAASTLAINHGRRPFIENKRCRKEQHRVDGVVNRNAGLVYQTDAILILIRLCADALSGAPTAKQCRVRRCSEIYPSRSSRACRLLVLEFSRPLRQNRKPDSYRADRRLRRSIRATRGAAPCVCRAVEHGRRIHRTPVR